LGTFWLKIEQFWSFEEISILKGVPKSHIYRVIRKGEVRVNKGRKKADYKLQIDDVVRIPPTTTF
jgi:23S rRNA pseudouridine955/2504/2580 synthase